MVLAWEANLTTAQAKMIKSLYKTSLVKNENIIHKKMQQLIAQSKAHTTLTSYAGIINKWKKYCYDKNIQDCPAISKHLAEFISELALDQAPHSTFNKLSPALVLHHQANGHTTTPPISEPFIKLLIEGAKREAAQRKPPIKKATSLTADQMHLLIDQTIWENGVGILGAVPNLIQLRTVVRIYTYYKTFCRFFFMSN